MVVFLSGIDRISDCVEYREHQTCENGLGRFVRICRRFSPLNFSGRNIPQISVLGPNVLRAENVDLNLRAPAVLPPARCVSDFVLGGTTTVDG